MDKKESCLFRIHRPYFAFNAYQYDLPWQSMQYVLDSDNVTLICIFRLPGMRIVVLFFFNSGVIFQTDLKITDWILPW